MWEHVAPIAAVAAFVLNFITVSIGALLKYQLGQTEIALNKAIVDAGKETDELIDRQGREFGETVAAMRQKIQEVELYVRDQYVRKDTFGMLMTKLETDVRGVGDRIEARLLRMEAKIDDGRKD